jgi:hypothetical protein
LEKKTNCFYLLDNLNHGCYEVDENYECRELPKISTVSGLPIEGNGQEDQEQDPYGYYSNRDTSATEGSMKNYFSMCDKTSKDKTKRKEDESDFYNNLYEK